MDGAIRTALKSGKALDVLVGKQGVHKALVLGVKEVVGLGRAVAVEHARVEGGEISAAFVVSLLGGERVRPLNAGVVDGLGGALASLVEGRISDASDTKRPDALGGRILAELRVARRRAL